MTKPGIGMYQIDSLPGVEFYESNCAFEEFKHRKETFRIIHVTLGAISYDIKSQPKLLKFGRQVLYGWFKNMVISGGQYKSMWEVREGGECPKVTAAIADRCISSRLFTQDLKDIVDMKVPPDKRVYFMVRTPFSIKTGEDCLIIKGRFGMGIFPKGTKHRKMK